MGSFERKIAREQFKRIYKEQFRPAWRRELRAQEYLIETKQEIPANKQNIVGKRMPTFNEWINAVKIASAVQEKTISSLEKEVSDREWDEPQEEVSGERQVQDDPRQVVEGKE